MRKINICNSCIKQDDCNQYRKNPTVNCTDCKRYESKEKDFFTKAMLEEFLDTVKN